MSLRTKLALTLVAMVVPLVGGFSVFRYYNVRQDIRERVTQRLMTRVVPRAVERCERHPEQFRYKRQGRFAVYAYRSDGTSANPNAPAFPEQLAWELADTSTEGPLTRWEAGPRGAEGVTGIETGKEGGPCARVLVLWQRDFAPDIGEVLRRVAFQSLAAAVVLLVVGLAAGVPLVRRIRRLTDAVEAFDERDFEVEAEADAGDEIGELARAFNASGQRIRETIDAVEARDAALREYVANTTHDLAIPVSVLQHRLRRLKSRLEGRRPASDDAASTQIIDGALEETQYVAALVSNMAARARLEAADTQASFHEVALGEVVERVASRHEELARQKGVTFNWATPAEPLEVQADSTLVEQAVSNCVQNAIQYNVEGGHVALVLDRVDDGFALRITDDGPGVPEATLDRLTDRQFRNDAARTRQPAGQGFGLAITRRVVELHGWAIDFHNREAGGLEVTIEGA